MIILLLSLFVGAYTLRFAAIVYKDGKKAGAIATVLVALLCFLSPVAMYFWN